MFMVLSSWPKSLREFTRFIWMSTECRVATNPHTKPVDLGCESAENWQLSSTSTVAIVIITQPVGWYSLYRPTKGGRLSRPKHCSKGAQPVLKTVYRSSCRDKHNCQQRDSNLDPLTAVRRANHSATETCQTHAFNHMASCWLLVLCGKLSWLMTHVGFWVHVKIAYRIVGDKRKGTCSSHSEVLEGGLVVMKGLAMWLNARWYVCK